MQSTEFKHCYRQNLIKSSKNTIVVHHEHKFCVWIVTYLFFGVIEKINNY